MALCLTACERGRNVVAIVGGRSIALEDVTPMIEAASSRTVADTAGELSAALFEAYLEEEVVLAAAGSTEDRGLTPTARSARARELLTSLCPTPPQPTEAEVDEYVAKEGLATSTGERIHLRQLILPDASAAGSARERARRGEDFDALSRELSRAPNAAKGGVIGWVERGQLPPEFEAAVFGLSVGDLSEPVASNAGWHVFQVTDRRAAGAAVDPSTRERARAALSGRRAEQVRLTCIQQLALRVGVRVRCENVPFPCRNPFEGEQ